MTYWKVVWDIDDDTQCRLPYVKDYEKSFPGISYYHCKLDALEHLRRDLGLLAEEIEDKLLDVRQEIHRLKGER